MKAEITQRTDTHVTFDISASTDEIKHAQEHAYDRYRPQVKAAGFRPGKAPDNIVAREIGDQTIQTEVLEHAMSHAYSDAVVQEKLQVVGQPDIQIKKWVPYTTLEFEAKIEILPPVKLPDYKKIKKAVKKVSIDAAKIDEMVEDLRRRVAKRVPALRAAELGDEVKFDFAGTKEGKPVEGATSKGFTLKLGSGQFIPGFEEELVGLKLGDTKSFTITFPKDYHEKSLAGQPVEFAVTMHDVTALELPKIDDAFASEVGPFKTIKELRDDIKDQLTVEAETAAKRDYENELLDEIVKKVDTKAPEPLVRQQIERLKSEMEQRLMQSGISIDQYLEMQKKSQEEFEKEITPEAEKRVKLALILSEVAKAEDLQVDNTEIDHEIETLRQQYTDPTMQKELAAERVREDIYNHLMSTKVINKLVEYAQKA
jgi:trigger factor